MDWRLVVGLIIVVPMVVYGFVRLPRIWSGADLPMQRLGSSGLPIGNQLRRGLVRGTAVGVVVCAVLVLAAVAVVVKASTTGDASRLAADVAVVLLLVFAALAIVNAGVILFNRPKFVVPPPLRDEPGALAGWFGRGGGDARARG